MKTATIKFLFLISLFILPQLLNAQNIKYRLFKDLDNLLKKAKASDAELLSPNNFQEGYDYYKDAMESLKDNDPLEDIKTSISRSALYLNKSIEYADSGKKFFKFTLKARRDAEKVFADSLAHKLWKKAESKFNDACSDFEHDERDDAKEESFEAEKIYRSAELKAIKRIYLDKARNALAEAKENGARKLAPKTFEKSRQLIYNAEKELEGNRYNNDYAHELAADAYSEAKHAAFLSKMFKEMNDKDETSEDLALYWEKSLRKIAEFFNIKPYFNNGPDSLVNEIIAHMENLKTDLKESDFLKNKNKALSSEIEKLKNRIKAIEKRLNRVNLFVRKVKEVKRSFSHGEAEVFTQNGNVVIRLRKLNFRPGSSVIQPKYFGLLSKVAKAILKFPNAFYIIEGHTDASGKADKNLFISQKRAEAVYKYLLANSNIPRSKIHAVGYGETRPIASNETESGKSKNRRIEILIKPAINIFNIE